WGHPEGKRPVEDQRGILANVVSTVGMAALDRAVRDCVQHLQSGHDLSRRKWIDGELAIAHLFHIFGERWARSPQNFYPLRQPRRKAPLDGTLRNRGRGNGGSAARFSETREGPA